MFQAGTGIRNGKYCEGDPWCSIKSNGGSPFHVCADSGPRLSRNSYLMHRSPSNFSPTIEGTRNMKERASPKPFRGGASPRRAALVDIETEGEEAYYRLKAWPARQGKLSVHTTMSYLAFPTFFQPPKMLRAPVQQPGSHGVKPLFILKCRFALHHTSMDAALSFRITIKPSAV